MNEGLAEADLLRRFATARIARLATVSAAGRPHLVPITFALVGSVVVSAVDHKPKATIELQRLRNIRATGRASVLVDEYDDDDWSRLWWVRLDGSARVLPQCERATEWLAAKYRQYRDHPPGGPFVWIDTDTVRGWNHG